MNKANAQKANCEKGQYNKKAKIFQTFRNLTLISQNPPQCPSGLLSLAFLPFGQMTPKLKGNIEKVEINVGTYDDGVEVTPLPSILYGMCYKIKPYQYFPHDTAQESYATDMFVISVSKPTKADNHTKMVLWVTDKRSWDGIINNDWGQIEPFKYVYCLIMHGL